MANWNDPSLTSTYANFLSDMKARDVDAASMADSPTNPPTGYIRWNTSLLKFQKWNGATWDDLVVAAAGGGTGGTTALGTMAYQNANGVAITGGTLSGITSFTISSHLSFATDNTYDLGSFAVQARYGFVKSGLVIPVGVDKWVP